MQCCVNVVADPGISVEFNLRAAAVTRESCHQARPKQTAAFKSTGTPKGLTYDGGGTEKRTGNQISISSKSSFSLAATVTHTQLNTNLLTH